jgi:hypothetical protein
MRRIYLYLSFFLLGISTGFLLCQFQEKNIPAEVVPASMPDIPIPDYSLLKYVLMRNYVFASILFLLNDDRAQIIMIFLASLLAGVEASSFGLVLGLVGIALHGPLELLGFSFVASAGHNYWERRRFLKGLSIGVLLIAVSAIIESSISLYILIHFLKNNIG